MNSSRLPGKAMLGIQGRPMAWHIVSRLRRCPRLAEVALATANGEAEAPLRDMAAESGIRCFAGSEADLIDRLYRAALEFEADAIVRITGDCPLVDAEVVGRLVDAFVEDPLRWDYVSNVRPRTFPHGLDAEVYPTRMLRLLWDEIEDPLSREWFPVYLWDREERFRTANVAHSIDLSALRWTVDYADDLEFVRAVYRALYHEGETFWMSEVLSLLEREPELSSMNSGHDSTAGWLSPTRPDEQNEGPS